MKGITLGDRFHVEFVAADSLGARSMAVYVKAGDIYIFLDPSVALGPKRYGYPPHPLELRAKEISWMRIEKRLEKSHVVVITHYHYDHYNPKRCELFRGKRLIIKNPEGHINRSQRLRSKVFLESLASLGIGWEVGDGKIFREGDVGIRISEPCPHGATDKLGYVLEVSIRFSGSCFLYTSDVQGPCRDDQVRFILEEDPDVVYCDGPMTYMLGYAYSHESLEASVENLKSILRNTRVKTLILDHHLTRDRRFKERMEEVFEEAMKLSKTITTASGAMGMEGVFLEAHRRDLYKENLNLEELERVLEWE